MNVAQNSIWENKQTAKHQEMLKSSLNTAILLYYIEIWNAHKTTWKDSLSSFWDGKITHFSETPWKINEVIMYKLTSYILGLSGLPDSQ